MGAGASTQVLDLSIVENLEDEFRKHGDKAVRRAWELTALQLSSDADLEMHLAQLRRLAGTLTKDKSSKENKERRYVSGNDRFVFFVNNYFDRYPHIC